MLGMHFQPDPWSHSQSQVPSAPAPYSLLQEPQEEEERGLAPSLSHLEPSPMELPSLLSPSQEKEEAVEKADEEINEDDDDEEEDEEEERKVSHSQPSDDFKAHSASGYGADLLSLGCGSTRQQEEEPERVKLDSSLFMDSPNQEILTEEEHVDDMDVSLEKAEGHHRVLQQQEDEDEEEDEDEDEEMPSEGARETESYGHTEEDDNNVEERHDNLNRSASPPAPAPSAWGQSNFSNPWAQPPHTSPSPDPDSPCQTPAQAWLQPSGPPEAPQPPQGPANGGSEPSTPEDYDSSSGVESRSDKQQTPQPPRQQPEQEQDLGIHLGGGDGEEEEAETLPADEVLGAGPPTAPASAPSSPSTSGDEASDTEGEMQINEPDSPPRSLAALREDEEAGEEPRAEGEEDGGGTTPQSANSVASYGFDCPSSNALSTAESCGKSPGIFSLEEQLSEEAKDPSLIQELTQPGGPVALLPMGGASLGGKVGAEALPEEAAAPSDALHPYYSAIGDKTDSFLAGNV